MLFRVHHAGFFHSFSREFSKRFSRPLKDREYSPRVKSILLPSDGALPSRQVVPLSFGAVRRNLVEAAGLAPARHRCTGFRNRTAAIYGATPRGWMTRLELVMARFTVGRVTCFASFTTENVFADENVSNRMPSHQRAANLRAKGGTPQSAQPMQSHQISLRKP